MATAQPLLDLGAARAIVRKYVGERTKVIACWQRPEPIYRVDIDEEKEDDNFYFAVVEDFPRYIGATRHVSVDRRSGRLTDLGRIGD